MVGKPHVCRRLNFGDEEEHEDPTSQQRNVLEEEMRRHLQNAREKWNFDFENEVPLEGQWQWEPVQSEPREEEMQPQEETDEDRPEN